MKPGSEFVAHEQPGFQADVYGVMDSDWYKSGQAFVVGTRLFTAYHVVDSYKKIGIETKRGWLTIDREHFRQIGGDIAYVTLTSDSLATLGISSKARFSDGAKMTNSGLFATVHAFGNSSMGFLEPHSSFGFVKYTGSTVSGFSGAPYYVGKTIYGMHVGGCSENLGYDSAYLSMLMRKGLEDSEDYLFRQVSKANDFQYSQSPYDPDEIRVKVNNRYFLVDADTFVKLNKSGKARQSTFQAVYDGENITPEDPAGERTNSETTTAMTRISSKIQEVDRMSEFDEQDQKNWKAPRHAIAGGSGQETAPEVARKEKPTKRNRRGSSSGPTTSSLGRRLIHAQRNEVSNDIAKSLKKLKAEQNRLRNASVDPSVKGLSDDLELGVLIQLRDYLNKITSNEVSSEPLAS